MPEITGKKVLVAVSNRGVEQDELKVPVEKLRAAGVDVLISAPEAGQVETLVGDWERGEKIPVDKPLPEVSDGDYDLLVLPGGTLNADALRLDPHAQGIVRSFSESGRPIAAICHGPWLLVETERTRGKNLTSYTSLKADITNSGGQWADEPVVIDREQGWTLITSRNPGDLDQFVDGIKQVLGETA